MNLQLATERHGAGVGGGEEGSPPPFPRTFARRTFSLSTIRFFDSRAVGVKRSRAHSYSLSLVSRLSSSRSSSPARSRPPPKRRVPSPHARAHAPSHTHSRPLTQKGRRKKGRTHALEGEAGRGRHAVARPFARALPPHQHSLTLSSLCTLPAILRAALALAHRPTVLRACVCCPSHSAVASVVVLQARFLAADRVAGFFLPAAASLAALALAAYACR